MGLTSHVKALEHIFSLIRQERIFEASSLLASLGSAFSHFPLLAICSLFFLLGISVGSVPLLWNLHVFRPMFDLWLWDRWTKFCMLFLSHGEREKAEDEKIDIVSPVGQDPLNLSVSYHAYASLNNCDFFGHLTNSCYPKVCDAARSKGLLKMFFLFYYANGSIALGGTHFDFIREIPMLAPFEVRVTFGAWDQKWLYVISKFVTSPKKGKKQADAVPTPLSPQTNVEGEQTNGKAIVEPDGAIVHCISVSQLCFKIDRITVPPALVLAVHGFSAPPPVQGASYSRENPPPSWVKVKKLVSKLHGGSRSQLKAFLKGGWRDQADRWWEDALDGCVEGGNDVLEAVTKLKSGAEELRLQSH